MLGAAAAQWNSALGIELFRYDSVDGFPINFAYDERQQQLLQQALLQRNIARYDSNIDQRGANLMQQSERLKQKQQQFAQQNQQFAAAVAAFERKAQQVTAANRTALQQEQQQLNARQQQLQQQGILCTGGRYQATQGPRVRLRFVTHLDISAAQIQQVLLASEYIAQTKFQ